MDYSTSDLTDQGKQAADIISKLDVDRDVKRSAFRALNQSSTLEEFEQRIGSLPIDKSVRDQLRLVRFRPEAPPLSMTPAPPAPSFQVRPPQKPAVPLTAPTGGDILAMAVGALPTVGAMVASGLGAITGVGAASMPWLAGAGAGAGESAKQLIMEKFGPEALSGPTIKVDPNPTGLGESIWKIGREAAMAAGTEGLGQWAARGTRALIGGPMHAAVNEPENRAVKELNETLGLNLTPGQIAGRTHMGTLYRMYQRLGEYNILSQQQIREVRTEGLENAANAIDHMVDSLVASPSSPTQTGYAVRDAMNAGYKMFQEVSGSIYQQLDQAAQGVMVDASPIKAEANRWLAKAATQTGYMPRTGDVSAGARKILEDAAGLPDWVPFSVAHEWRKKLISASPEVGKLFAGEGKEAAKKMVGIVTETMDNSAQALNPSAARLWSAARKFYKNGAEVFDNAVINRMLNTDRGAEMVVAELKPGMVDYATKVRSAILDYPVKFGSKTDQDAALMTWRQLQEQYIRTHLLRAPEEGQRAAGEQLATISEEGLRSLKKNLEKQGRGMLDTMFNPPNIGSPHATRMLSGGPVVLQNLRDIGEAFSRLDRIPTEMRSWQIRGMELASGILYGMLTGKGVEQSLGYGVGVVGISEILPWLITKSVYNKRASGYIVDGFRGFFRATPAAKTTGKITVNIANRGMYNPRFPSLAGSLAANLFRAYEEVEKDSEQIQKKLSKGKGEFANPYEVMPLAPRTGPVGGKGDLSNPY